MVPKCALVHGAYYIGHCRNANEARWNAHLGKFEHWQHDCGFTYVETIYHPEDDQRFDTFEPEALINVPLYPLP